MKRIRIIFLSLLAAISFTACDNMHPEIDISLNTDYTEILQAISDANRSLAEKLALIEAAAGTGLTLDQSVLDLIREALSSLGGTMDEKLAAVMAAMQDQATALETKLALAEAAVTAGFADAVTQQALLQQAIASLGGTLEEKIAAIEEAVKAQTTALETKLGLIEAAANAGFADTAKAQALIAAALEATGKTMEEKLEALKEAVNSQTAPLSAKLALIETAAKTGFADAGKQQELLQEALNSLGGTLEEKLAAIEEAVQSSSSGLEAKVDLIAAALEKGLGDQTTAVNNMKTALGATLGTLDTQLGELLDQVLTDLADISTKLSTEELAKVFKTIADAIDSESQSEEQMLSAIQEAFKDLEDTLEHILALSATLPAEYSSLKDAWTAGDVIFVFVDGLAAPKHLQMCYDGTSWTTKQMDGDTEAKDLLKLNNGTTFTLNAIYLPAGNNVGIVASGTDFVFNNASPWWYLSCTQDITVAKGDLKGELELQVPDGYVFFSVPDASADAGTQIELREPDLTPQAVASVAADGTVHHTFVAHGAPLKGLFRDGAQKGYCFGGILADEVRNVQTDYHFTLVKGGWKGSYYSKAVPATLYTGSAGSRSFTLASPADWTAITDYKPIDMGCDVIYSSKLTRVYWSSCNLGATSADPADGEATYGNYYAWGETSPKEAFYWKNYKWSNADSTAVTKYTGASDKLVPGIDVLLPEDDAANAALGGIWRMPQTRDWEILCSDLFCKWTGNGAGYVVTGKKAGYDGPDGPSLFFPFTGCYLSTGLEEKGTSGYCWSATRKNEDQAYCTYIGGAFYYPRSRYCGLPVRPVTN